jgi:hypothetical protein
MNLVGRAVDVISAGKSLFLTKNQSHCYSDTLPRHKFQTRPRLKGLSENGKKLCISPGKCTQALLCLDIKGDV